MLDWMHAKRCVFLDSFFRGITWFGSLWLLLPCSVFVVCLFWVRRAEQDARLLGTALAVSVLLVHGVKRAFRRPRPQKYPSVVRMPHDGSFPSAHTAQIAAFCLALAVIAAGHLAPLGAWAVLLLAIFLITAVGLSRVYLQVHYLSDVVAGLVMGCLAVAGVAFFLGKG